MNDNGDTETAPALVAASDVVGEKGTDEFKPTAAPTKVDVATQTEVVTPITSGAQSGVIPSVRIVGASGVYAAIVNGMYEPTDELSEGNVTIYRNVGNGGVWLEYRASNKQWQVKPTASKGTDVCWAYCTVPVKRLPYQECPGGQWQVSDGSRHVSQPAVIIAAVSEEEVEAYRAELEREAGRVVKGTSNVRIQGATGISAADINGVYEPTDELSGNVTVYRKLGAGDWWLEYRASVKQWQVKPTASKGTDVCWAYCTVPVKRLPYQECPGGQWQVSDGSRHVSQPAVIIAAVSEEEVEAYRAELEREAGRVVKGTSNVRIQGATGISAADINGVYEPTDELSGNVTVYRKLGAGDWWLEYRASVKQWQVKPTASKGTDVCWARCAVPVKCLPTECPGGQWQAYDGSKFNPQPVVTVSVASEEEIEACRVVKGICSVRIVGATGTNADNINGVFEPTDELSEGNVTFYRKVGGGGCLEYHASTKQWQVKTTASKGTNTCWAFCIISAKRLPQDCPRGQWRVSNGSKLETQPAVTVSYYLN